MIPGNASGKSIILTINIKLAPVETDASRIPSGISRREDSTNLARKGMAATDKETDAATGPIVVPVRNKVSGNKDTSKIT